jgi:hypothetical protein
MNDSGSKNPARRRKGRALLLAAAGASVLLMQGCNRVGSGNLMPFPGEPDMAQPETPMDMSAPKDLRSSTD